MFWKKKPGDWKPAITPLPLQKYWARIRRCADTGLEKMRGRPLTLEEWKMGFYVFK